jgi:hypothetical protein
MTRINEDPNHFKTVRNMGRTMTPQAWGLDNSDILARNVPLLLEIITKQQKALRRISVIKDVDWMIELAKEALKGGEEMEAIEKLKGII